MMRKWTAAVAALFVACTVVTPARIARAEEAEWQAPEDGVYSEKQLLTYLRLTKTRTADTKAALKSLEGVEDPLTAARITTKVAEKFDADLKKAGVSQAEYEWVSRQASEAWSVLLMKQMTDGVTGQFAESGKKSSAELAEAKKKLAVHEAALKAGRRVMSAEDRAQAVASAKEEQQSAADEAKDYTAQAAEAAKEAAEYDAEAKAADKAAKAPPPRDVAKEDRADYVEGKKAEAAEARESAKDARAREAELKQGAAEATARAAAAAARAKAPDVPVTDDEKEAVKAENEGAVQDLKRQIADAEQMLASLREIGASTDKSVETETAKVPPQNLELLRKHRKAYNEAHGMQELNEEPASGEGAADPAAKGEAKSADEPSKEE